MKHGSQISQLSQELEIGVVRIMIRHLLSDTWLHTLLPNVHLECNQYRLMTLVSVGHAKTAGSGFSDTRCRVI